MNEKLPYKPSDEEVAKTAENQSVHQRVMGEIRAENLEKLSQQDIELLKRIENVTYSDTLARPQDRWLGAGCYIDGHLVEVNVVLNNKESNEYESSLSVDYQTIVSGYSDGKNPLESNPLIGGVAKK